MPSLMGDWLKDWEDDFTPKSNHPAHRGAII